MYVKRNQNHYAVIGIYWKNDIQNFTQINLKFIHTRDCTRYNVDAFVANFVSMAYNIHVAYGE